MTGERGMGENIITRVSFGVHTEFYSTKSKFENISANLALKSREKFKKTVYYSIALF